MANMSYCRFQNTYRDLSDCVNALDQGSPSDLSNAELRAARDMMQLCEQLLSFYDEILDEAEDRKNMEDVE